MLNTFEYKYANEVMSLSKFNNKLSKSVGVTLRGPEMSTYYCNNEKHSFNP